MVNLSKQLWWITFGMWNHRNQEMFSKGVVDTLSARKEGIPHATTGTEHIERHEVTPTKGNAKDIRLIQVKKEIIEECVRER